MGSDIFYNERWFLWEAVRLVCAVTGMRANPAPQARIACGFNPRRGMGAGSACGAEEHAGSTRPRLCAAIWRRGILWEAMRSIMSGGFYGKRYALYGLYLTYGQPRPAG